MVPAHFHDVTDDKMKSNFVKNTIGPNLNHSKISLSLKTTIKIVEHILTTREISCGFGLVQNFYYNS